MAAGIRQRPSGASSDSTSASVQLGVTICSECEAGNAADRRFCGQCGKPLYEQCPSCGVECRTGEAFCGGCGVRVRDFLQEQMDQAEAALAEAAGYESKLQWDDAIRALRAVRLADHRELTILSKRIEETLGRLCNEAERRTLHLEADVARSQELIKARAYKDAVQLLERLPPPLRTAETDKLLAEAKFKVKEIADLKAEIVAAAEQRQYLELAPKIQRLLTLQPDSERIRRLAEKVRDSLLAAANKKLMAFEYKQARRIIDGVPECAIDENTITRAGRIAEFNWLVDDLHLAPIIDEPLVAIAKRFAKNAPGDKKNVERCSKLFRLVAENPKASSKRFPAIEWTPAPRRAHLCCAIDWLGGSERLQLSDDTVASVWNHEPGRYFVAVGLALQGLDAATVPTNLYKPEKQGLFGQFSLGKRKAAARRAWGIDIGESSMKVIRMAAASDDAEPIVDCCEQFPHRMPLNRPEAEASRNKLIAESLTAFLAKHPLDKTDRICVSFPSQKILGRPLRLPEANPKKLNEIVQFEAKQRIPIPLDELAWTYHSFANSASEAEPIETVELPNTLLIAAKQRDVRELTLIFEDVQIPLHVVQSDAIALFNFAVFEGLIDLATAPEVERQAIALLDVGAAATNIVIVTGDRPWFRSFRRGGDDFTSVAAQRLHLTKDQAEQAKFDPSGLRRISEMHAAFEPLFVQLTDEIHRSLESFTKETGRTVSRMLGVGGGFRLHGLLKYVRNGP